MKTYLIILVFLMTYLVCHSQQALPLSDADQATVDRYEEMVTFYKNNEEYTNAVSHLSKIAFIYWDNQRADKTIDYFLETIPIYEELNDLENILKVYSNIALIYLDMEDLPNARRYFDKSLEVRRQTGSGRLISSGLVDLAYTISLEGSYDRATEYLDEAKNIAQNENYQTLLLAIYNQLSKNYDNLGIIAQADEFRQKYLTQRDYLSTQILREDFQEREERSQVEIRRTQAERRAQELEMKLQQLIFQEEQEAIKLIVAAKEDSLQLAQQRDSIVQQEMRLLEADRELQQAQLEKQLEQQRAQRVIILYGIGVVIIGTFLLIIMYRNYRAKRKANKKLELINKEIENKSKQLQEAYYKIENQNIKITHSINYAKEIQKALLPPRDALQKFLPESFIFFKPLHVVSGDFYWFKEINEHADKKPKEKKYAEKAFADTANYYNQPGDEFSNSSENDDFLPIKGNKFMISAVDCTGHGVPGAFMSMIGYNLLDEITHHGITTPDEILTNLHKGIRRTLKQEEGTNRDGMDLSLCVINKENRTLDFSGAQTSIVYIQNGEAKVIRGDRMSIGGVQKEMERNFSKTTIKVDKPTWFYIFSDGYIDQFGGPKNRKLLLKNFTNLLLDIYKEPMDLQEKMLKQYFFEWKNKEDQIDDVLVIGFKLGGNGI